MQIEQLNLRNWKNFKTVDLPLQKRAFIAGPNASGKSNLLDALKFLRDVADTEGGFQRAVRARGGVSQIRCLHARRKPNVLLDVVVRTNGTRWRYLLEFKQDNMRRPLIEREEVYKDDKRILQRPDTDDKADPNRLSQTHLEQVNANREFREVATLLADIRYLHVVPQLIREVDRIKVRKDDPYGSDFLEQIAQTNKKTLQSRLRRINAALRVAVPQLKELKLEPDERGVPHLRGLYEHRRPNAGWQSEEQFSDGTLRLLGLLWAFLEGSAPLLLEEPELSLHVAVVRFIPSMMVRAARKTQRQIIISTHSIELLTDPGIAPEEVIMLQPSPDGTSAVPASSLSDIQPLLQQGMPMGEIVMAHTAPSQAEQLALFEE
jgi:predicted ATPase